MANRFTFIDLFAGIGGFRVAFERFEGACVFSSEIDARARETYHSNFDEWPEGDIREFTSERISDETLDLMIPDHDILAGGFPCQPFSSAGVSSRNSLGKAHGLLDKSKGTLFFDICRIAKAKRPKVLFLENVSNIVRHDKGRTFGIIRSTLEEGLGYKLFYKVLNSETVVPQRRRRCYFVAFRDTNIDFNFPELTGSPIPLRTALEESVSEHYTLSDRAWEGHKRRTKANLARGTGFTAYEADLDKPSNTIVARYYKDGKECLVPQEGKNPRLLTPRECARLQGFPESFVLHPSRSAAYKQFGNSVPVPVIEAITAQILKTPEFKKDGRPSKPKRAVKKYVRYKGDEYPTGDEGQKSAA